MMLATDPLLEDEKAKVVFNAVTRDRRVTLKKLVRELSIGRGEVQEKLQALSSGG